VFRPTGFADLAGRRVGIFGYGVEGRTTRRRLRDVTDTIVLVDDDDVDPDVIVTSHGGLEALRGCEVVLKSPGIPRRRNDVLELERGGVTVTSSLNLWLHDVDRTRVVAITGTKGKSTTTALSVRRHCASATSADPRTIPTSTLRRGGSFSRSLVSNPSTSTWRPHWSW
jgi:UDP-N-acetylmuramoylalanine-D-glutamate ligase